jgi:hypothetical protein
MDTGQAQGAASTGESVETTQTQSPAFAKATAGREPKAAGKPSISSLNDELRKELGVDPATHKASQDNPATHKASQDKEPEEEEKPEEQEQEPEEQEQEQPAEADLPSEASADEGAEEPEVPKDWVPSAKARVAEEARKRRERTAERDQWKAEAERLNAQLQQATAVQLRPTKALSEVVDRQSLTAAENHWKEIRRFARTNPDGAEDVLVGKDANGNEIRRDFPREEIIQMGLDADEAMEALPARRAFVAEAEAQIAQARAVYPDLWKATEAGQQAAGIVQRAPWILQEPDWAFVIGDYLAGRKLRMARQGKSGGGKALSPGAQAILGAPKVAPAPGVIKSRSASGGPGEGSARGAGSGRVDDKQARDELAEREFSPEAMDDYITKLRQAHGATSGPLKKTLV